MMNTSSVLGTARVYRTVPCPPTCRWHGTDVLHARHEQLVDVDVVTFADAVNRLGLTGVVGFSYEDLATSAVVFNDRRCVNYSVGMSKALYSFTGAYRMGKGFMPSGTQYAIVENPDGSVEACVVG